MFFVFQDSETLTGVEVRLAGRVHAIRESGAKLIFYDVRGESTKIQVINTYEWLDLIQAQREIIYCGQMLLY